MSGHSHWSGIKFKKAINDAKKGKVFTKIAALIYSAVKEGGGADPTMNPRLRLVLDKARLANMPKDNIKRAIDKATGVGGATYEKVSYEGYGPGGVAIMVEALTDNRNRTFPEIRKTMESKGGTMGSPGCVSYLFARKGMIVVKKDASAEDALMEIVLEAGAEDLSTEGEAYEITTPVEGLFDVKNALDAKKIATESAELTMIPGTYVKVEGEDAAKVLRLVEALEDHDDVQAVHANFDIDDELMAQLQG